VLHILEKLDIKVAQQPRWGWMLYSRCLLCQAEGRRREAGTKSGTQQLYCPAPRNVL
jgi:hypothetical protein